MPVFIYYLFTVVFSIICFTIQAHYFKNHISVYYAALFIAITVNCFGYFQLSMAKSIGQATFALQTSYLGASFVPLFSFLCISDLTKFNPKWYIKTFVFAISFIICMCSFTIGNHPIYYKSIDISFYNNTCYLIKEYGPLHFIYPIYLFGMMMFSLVIIIISFGKRRQISYVRSTTLFIVLLISFATYFIERLLKLNIELVPISLNIEEFAILFLLNRIKLYDVSGIATNNKINSKSYGIITFKSEKKFIGSIGSASEWFPVLDELFVDYKIPDHLSKSSPILSKISEWMNENISFDEEYFDIGDKIIKAEYSKGFVNGEKHIHIISLSDDTKQHQLTNMIKNYNELLEKQVDEKTKQVKDIEEDIILSMASIVENRDNNTGGHIKRTSDVVKIFINELRKDPAFKDLNDAECERIIKAAPLHDFGKIGVPDEILNKPGKFTDEEYEIMKIHPAKGADIVKQILKNSDDNYFNKIAINVAHYHHEKWNGSGYPEGLKENEIPIEARIMALADVFDALVSKRVYKDQFSYDKAFSIIQESCGNHFDPALCNVFLKCKPKLEELYNSYVD